ncbi:DUF1592 domain-containing protein [Novosphingobium sp. TH158]|uniref:DUF1592 domain-containing protein n=1 Tax=Novosphingobium sp. TH158 TaxID=2067455 RepID=UPI000C7DD6AB|nr:DUF1592 domain-containing protein [Novosphingobium sp. TH158]PLK27493.1 hypothetical protein C0V78_11795 [Novosphingobium sp. TH158]
MTRKHPSFLRKTCIGLGLALAGTLAWTQQDGARVAGPAQAAESGPATAPGNVRRLTESQYRATIADIFAPDVPIAGRFERGLRVDGLLAVGTTYGGMSAFSIEQYDISARSIAAEVTSEKRRAQFMPCQPKDEAAFDKACATRFVETYGQRLFRRPLTSAERDRYVTVAATAQQKLGKFHDGLEFALAGMLVSPHFLMRIERTEPDPARPGQQRLDAWSKATRLSYFLSDTAPDAELLRAAASGEIHTEAGLARQVDRLVSSPKLEKAVRSFFSDMLLFDGFNDLFKDPSIYPAYTVAVANDAQEQTLRTIVSHLVADRGDYRGLFTTRKTWMNRSLGIIYRQPVPTRNGWEQTEYAPSSQRSGILTDISLLALHSHPGRSSPTLRGKSLREVFLCEKVPDPPANVNFSVVQDAVNRPGSTARMRLAEHNDNPACAGCHKITDPMGFTLESFDGIGTFRSKENGVTLDLTGSLMGASFTGATGLGKALHDHPGLPVCLADKMLRTASGRKANPAEEPYLEKLAEQFAANGYRVPDLMRAIATGPAFFTISNPALVPAGTKTAITRKKGDNS